jgi:hypothetical protein
MKIWIQGPFKWYQVWARLKVWRWGVQRPSTEPLVRYVQDAFDIVPALVTEPIVLEFSPVFHFPPK